MPTGNGHVLGSSSDRSSTLSNGSPISNIRDIWSTRFNNTPASNTTTTNATTTSTQSNTETKENNTKGPSKFSSPTKSWKELDNDILIEEIHHDVINISDHDSDDDDQNTASVVIQSPHVPDQKRPNITIKQELIDDLGDNDSVIEMIDDEFDDELKNESYELLADTTVIDDIFGTDTLMDDFNNINNVIMNDPENCDDPGKEIITCPICQDRMPREQLTDHLDGCTGIVIKVERKKGGAAAKKPKSLPFYKNRSVASTSRVGPISPLEVGALRAAGYTESVIERLKKETAEENEYNARIMLEMKEDERRNNSTSLRLTEPINIDNGDEIVLDELDCPNCGTKVNANSINDHLDSCLDASTSQADQSHSSNISQVEPPQSVHSDMVQCPICEQHFEVNQINQHIDDVCLNNS